MERATVYVCETPQALALDRGDAQDAGLLYRKQLIYAGNFVKNVDGKEQRFEVTRDLLAHWRATFQRFKSKGIKVPVPVEHSTNPENNRGELVELELADEPSGRASLYGVIRFRDKDAAKLAHTANVSLYIPPEFVDGTGDKYARPIQHVALTDYPVIPGLSEFQPIVASFQPNLNKGVAMSLQTLAEKLAIPFADKDDATVEAEIFTKFQTLMAEVDKLKAKIVELGGEVDGAAPAAEGEAVAASHTKPMKPSAAMLGLLRDNRQNTLDRLLNAGKITPAQLKQLQADWLKDEKLELALSHGAPSDAAWDGVIKTLELSHGVKLGEKTTAQRVPTGEDNAVIRDAERRRKEAEQRRGKR